jgi:hypothetical protein
MATHFPFHAATISKCGKFCTLNTKATSILLNTVKQCYVYQNPTTTNEITFSTSQMILKNRNFIYGKKITFLNKSARFTINGFNQRESLRNFKIEGLETFNVGRNVSIKLSEI